MMTVSQHTQYHSTENCSVLTLTQTLKLNETQLSSISYVPPTIYFQNASSLLQLPEVVCGTDRRHL